MRGNDETLLENTVSDSSNSSSCSSSRSSASSHSFLLPDSSISINNSQESGLRASFSSNSLILVLSRCPGYTVNINMKLQVRNIFYLY